MCPPGHGVQETDPPILVKVPNAQFEHVSWAGAEVNFPAMQSVHEEALSTLDDLPGAQSVQLLALVAYLPATHLMHVVLPDAVATAPLGQALHAASPTTSP